MITFINASSLADNAGGASITVGQPTGVVPGDLIVLLILLETSNTVVISPPDLTWYQPPLEDNPVAGIPSRVAVYYHTVEVSEPTWVFRFGASVQAYAVASAYRGVGTIDIMGWSTGTSGPVVGPVVTPAQSNGTVVCLVGNYQGSGSSHVALNVSELTVRFNLTSSDGDVTLAMGDAPGPTGGSPTGPVGGISTSIAWACPLLVLNPLGTIPATATSIGVVPTATSTNVGSALTVAATVPAALQAGDILVAFLHMSSTFGGGFIPWAISIPGGWTQQDEIDVQPSGGVIGIQGGFYTHPVTNPASEPGTYSWTVSGGGGATPNHMAIDMVAVRGCSTIDAFTRATQATALGSITPTGITPAKDNEPLVLWAAWGSDSGGPSVEIISIQQEVTIGNQAHAIFSAISPLAGVISPSYSMANVASSGASLAYQVAFLPLANNIPKIVGSTVVNRYSAVTSVAITIPPGCANGDVLVAHVVGPTGGTITPPAGWTAIPNASADDGHFMAKAFSHVFAVADPGSVTFNLSGSTTGFASIIATRNVVPASLIAANGITQGQTPSLNLIPPFALILMYETCANNPISAAGLGLPNEMFITPFTYNPDSTNGGNITRSGALSVVLQSGPNGGVIGTQYRTAGGSVSGPQLTIAIGGVSPVVPPTLPAASLNNTLLLYSMGQKPGWSKHILPFNVLTVRECVLPGDTDIAILALADDKNVYRLFNNPQGPALVATAESQPLPTRKQLGAPELWDTTKNFLYFYIEGQDLANFTYQWATDISNFNTFRPPTPLRMDVGRNIINDFGKQIILRFIHSAIPGVGVTPLISYLKIAYTLGGRIS